MTLKLHKLATLIILLIASNSIYAQNKPKSSFSLDGEFRTRMQYSPSQDGRNKLVPKEMAPGTNTPSRLTLWQRTRLTAKYKLGRVETNLTIQDARPFLSAKSKAAFWASNNVNGLSLHTAWAKLYFFEGNGSSLGLKIGRQEFKNTDSRILSARNWNDYGAAFDAISLEGEHSNIGLDWNLSWAFNSVDVPSMANKPFRNVAFLELRKKFGDALKVNAFAMTETYEAPNNYDDIFSRNTLGINPVFENSYMKIQGSFYKQFGLSGYTNTNDKIKYGGMIYTVSGMYKGGLFNIGAGFDSYSGKAYDDTDIDQKQFFALCNGGHIFFGTTDFNSRYGKNEGLSDLYITTQFMLAQNIKIKLNYYNIWFTNSPGVDANGNDVKQLGNDIDFEIYYRPQKDIEVMLGYSVMLPSQEFVELQLGANNDAKFHGWASAMITFRPKFLNKTK